MTTSSYSAAGALSTIRYLAFAVCLFSTAAWADPPQFSTGAFLFAIQYGPGFWGLDRANLAAQAGAQNADLFIGDVQNTHTVSLSMAYNIKGHASVGADFTATGWNITNANRGGAGWIVGKVAWHPLELVWMNKEKRPVPLDVAPFFGVGYGIAGRVRGMDGLVLETGFTADYFFTRFFGLGLFTRFVFLEWNNLYIDYENRSLPGNTVALPKGSGGNFISIGFSLTFRAGD